VNKSGTADAASGNDPDQKQVSQGAILDRRVSY
jgi:hypothetical protein